MGPPKRTLRPAGVEVSFPHVGVGAFYLHMSRPNRWLRRYALFFDRFDIIDLDQSLHLHRYDSHGKAETVRECEWLIERGLLRQVTETELVGDMEDARLAELDRLINEKVEEAARAEASYESHLEQPRRPQVVPAAAEVHFHAWTRIAADIAALRSQRAVLSTGTIERAITTNLDQEWLSGVRAVDQVMEAPGLMRFAVSDLPVPAHTTPWAEIQAFKEDEDTQSRLRSLRAWFGTTARGGITLAEAADRIADELGRYRSHLKGAGLRIHSITLEAVLKMGAVPSDIDLSTWDALHSKPFALTQMSAFGRREEEAAPGRELSYLVKVEEAGL
jgi:hypothetical protein